MPYEHKELTFGTRFSGELSSGNCDSTSGGFVTLSQSLTDFARFYEFLGFNGLYAGVEQFYCAGQFYGVGSDT